MQPATIGQQVDLAASRKERVFCESKALHRERYSLGCRNYCISSAWRTSIPFRCSVARIGGGGSAGNLAQVPNVNAALFLLGGTHGYKAALSLA